MSRLLSSLALSSSAIGLLRNGPTCGAASVSTSCRFFSSATIAPSTLASKMSAAATQQSAAATHSATAPTPLQSSASSSSSSSSASASTSGSASGSASSSSSGVDSRLSVGAYVPLFPEFSTSPLSPPPPFLVDRREAQSVELRQRLRFAPVPESLAQLSMHESAIEHLRERVALTDEQTAQLRAVSSLSTANNKQRLSFEFRRVIEHYAKDGEHRNTGDSAVQAAILSLKINNMLRHRVVHRRDRHSIRGVNLLKQQRRKILLYLRKKDFKKYAQVMADFDIHEDELLLQGKTLKSGTQLRRVRR